MTPPQQQRHKPDLWPGGAIYPANGSPGAEPRPGTMGTAVRSRGCTGSCHGNMVASSAVCQQESVHQLLLFLEPWFHPLFLLLPHIQQTCIVKSAQGDFFFFWGIKINLCSQPKSQGGSAPVRTVSPSLTDNLYRFCLQEVKLVPEMSAGQWSSTKNLAAQN